MYWFFLSTFLFLSLTLHHLFMHVYLSISHTTNKLLVCLINSYQDKTQFSILITAPLDSLDIINSVKKKSLSNTLRHTCGNYNSAKNPVREMITIPRCNIAQLLNSLARNVIMERTLDRTLRVIHFVYGIFFMGGLKKKKKKKKKKKNGRQFIIRPIPNETML